VRPTCARFLNMLAGLSCQTPLQVSWVTCDYSTGHSVTGPHSTPGVTSLAYWRAAWECGGYGNSA